MSSLPPPVVAVIQDLTVDDSDCDNDITQNQQSDMAVSNNVAPPWPTQGGNDEDDDELFALNLSRPPLPPPRGSASSEGR